MFLGIFDFIANWLVGLSTAMLAIIDDILLACNKISGIEDVTISGESSDFLIYLFQNKRISFAFAVAAVLGLILLILITVFQICINFAKEKTEETPVSIAKKAAKNILLLLFVPTFMIVVIALSNAFVRAMYEGTMSGSTSLGQFMFEIFAEDAVLSDAHPFSGDNPLSYHTSCKNMWQYLDLWDYHFFYSYLIGGLMIYVLMGTVLMLVERIISIVLLYIVSPFVVAASVTDDGAKFKAWRDQMMIKFFTGHGAIIAINVYLLVVNLVMKSDVVFFEDSWSLNTFTKLVFICGGAFSLKSVQAIIGNLMQIGAGDKAVAESAAAGSKLGGFLKSGALAPFKGVRGIANFHRDRKEYAGTHLNKKTGKMEKDGFFRSLGSAVAHGVGFKTNRDYGGFSATANRDREALGNNKSKSNDPVKDAIQGPQQQKSSNDTNQQPQQKNKSQSMVENAIRGH